MLYLGYDEVAHHSGPWTGDAFGDMAMKTWTDAGVEPSITWVKESYTGAAYIFMRNGSTWTLQQRIVASDGEYYDRFGESVAISGDHAIVGSPYDGGVFGSAGAGSAYVFVRNGDTWTQQQKIMGSNTDEYDKFGTSVAMSGGACASKGEA